MQQKASFSKGHLFFAFPPKKNGNLRLNAILEGETFCLQLKSKKKVFLEPLSLQTSNFKKNKTVKTGFEEISETSINKASTAPFLLFSHDFVTLSSYRAAVE